MGGRRSRFFRSRGISALLLRVWAAIGFRGLFLLLFTVVTALWFPLPGPRPQIVTLPLMFVLIVLLWGRQRRPRKVPLWDRVVGPLVRSDEEYCVILRPFGEDGKTIFTAPLTGPLGMYSILRPAFTLEQVIAVQAQSALEMKTYALVDHHQVLAPPGPEWMRTPPTRDEWRRPVEALLRRAHSIVLVFPAGQSIRESLKWEISRITALGIQSRVIINIAANDQHAHEHACTTLAAFRSAAGRVDELTAADIKYFRDRLSTRASLAKFVSEPGREPGLLQWSAPKGTAAVVIGPALEEAFAAIEREMAGTDFAARYPSPIPDLPEVEPVRRLGRKWRAPEPPAVPTRRAVHEVLPDPKDVNGDIVVTVVRGIFQPPVDAGTWSETTDLLIEGGVVADRSQVHFREFRRAPARFRSPAANAHALAADLGRAIVRHPSGHHVVCSSDLAGNSVLLALRGPGLAARITGSVHVDPVFLDGSDDGTRRRRKVANGLAVLVLIVFVVAVLRAVTIGQAMWLTIVALPVLTFCAGLMYLLVRRRWAAFTVRLRDSYRLPEQLDTPLLIIGTGAAVRRRCLGVVLGIDRAVYARVAAIDTWHRGVFAEGARAWDRILVVAALGGGLGTASYFAVELARSADLVSSSTVAGKLLITIPIVLWAVGFLAVLSWLSAWNGTEYRAFDPMTAIIEIAGAALMLIATVAQTILLLPFGPWTAFGAVELDIGAGAVPAGAGDVHRVELSAGRVRRSGKRTGTVLSTELAHHLGDMVRADRYERAR
ncbi:hypothetical protein NONO_c22230 [Nocardia nova SH22a]|uniref:Uncharacterized protein n=1 Tax=Nocardia nova SH22a TaxID=1415166 RepID=W5TIG6_9NOCA|nr:hypothetical protein [Nocardia nova]AHH17021.1 hypothetical protein NONO_c22230 [Nocardia nova SH22a]